MLLLKNGALYSVTVGPLSVNHVDYATLKRQKWASLAQVPLHNNLKVCIGNKSIACTEAMLDRMRK